MSPEHAARIEALVQRCRPLLDSERGMRAVQELLGQLDVGVLEAIMVTKRLLDPCPLPHARDVVLAHRPRTTVPAEVTEHAHDLAGAVRHAAGGGVTLVAVDGAGGAGKTCLVRATTALLDAAWTISGNFHARPDWQRLRDQVLVPLRAGRPAPGVPPRTAVLIVDGTASTRPELAPYYHLKVFVDTPADLRALRLGDEPPDPRDDHYLRTTWPQTRAHLLVRGY